MFWSVVGYLLLVVIFAFLLLVFLDVLKQKPPRQALEQRHLRLLDAPYDQEKDSA